MTQESAPKFDEKILYKTRQHWIIPVIQSVKYICISAIPVIFLTYFISNYSWMWVSIIFSITSFVIILYLRYLWMHSWLFVGNQKVTLSIRNGIFSQYAMNVRYRNIRDCAVSKHSIWSFLFKYGTIFIRSSANEGDFHANFVPKVGKVYALVNALSRYNDDERAEIENVESLHNYHIKKESTHTADQTLHSKHH